LRRVAQLIRPSVNDWDEGKIRSIFHPWDAEDILKIKLPLNKTEDVVA